MDDAPRSRYQFGVRSLLTLTAVSAALFAVFRWLGLEPRTSLFIAGILALALAGAVALVAALARFGMGEERSTNDGTSTATEKRS